MNSMRKLFLFLIPIFFASRPALAQNAERLPKMGAFFTFGENDVIRFENTECDCGCDGDGFWNAGLMYLQPFADHFSFKTGLSFQKHNYTTSWIDFSENNYLMELKRSGTIAAGRSAWHSRRIPEVFIYRPWHPVRYRNQNTNIDCQSGVGSEFGLGARYVLKNGWEVAVGAQMQLHSLIAFNRSTYQQHFTNSGVFVQCCSL
jgi:hypothetical protein